MTGHYPVAPLSSTSPWARDHNTPFANCPTDSNVALAQETKNATSLRPKKSHLIWSQKSHLIGSQSGNSSRSARTDFSFPTSAIQPAFDWDPCRSFWQIQPHLLWPTAPALRIKFTLKFRNPLLKFPECTTTFCGAQVEHKMTLLDMTPHNASWRWFVVTVVAFVGWFFHYPRIHHIWFGYGLREHFKMFQIKISPTHAPVIEPPKLASVRMHHFLQSTVTLKKVQHLTFPWGNGSSAQLLLV